MSFCLRKARCFSDIAFTVALVAALAFPPKYALADQHGEQGSPPSAFYCSDYRAFLGIETATEVSDCSSLERSINEADGLPARDYLNAYQSRFGETSVVGTLAVALEANLEGDTRGAFEALNLADRTFYGAMIDRGDENRAYVYAVFFSAGTADLVRRLCETGHGASQCDPIPGFMTAREMLNDSFSFLDAADPFLVLYCLLRTDALTARIVDVLLSRPFNLCLAAQEYGI